MGFFDRNDNNNNQSSSRWDFFGTNPSNNSGDNNNNDNNSSYSNNSIFGNLFGMGNSKNGRNNSGIILILIVILVYAVLFQGNAGCNGQTASTVQRTKLETTFEEGESYFIESPDTWTSSDLETYMSYFAETTGVAPALCIYEGEDLLEDKDVEAYAEQYYKEHFTDEVHFLYVYHPLGIRDYAAASYVGSEAAAVVDDEALSIFEENLISNLQNSSVEQNQVFANTYLATTTSIMGLVQETNPTTKVIVIIIAVGLIALFFLRQTKRVNKDFGPNGRVVDTNKMDSSDESSDTDNKEEN